MTHARTSHMCSTFLDPTDGALKVMVSGGNDDSGNALANSEIFSVADNAWKDGKFRLFKENIREIS